MGDRIDKDGRLTDADHWSAPAQPWTTANLDAHAADVARVSETHRAECDLDEDCDCVRCPECGAVGSVELGGLIVCPAIECANYHRTIGETD